MIAPIVAGILMLTPSAFAADMIEVVPGEVSVEVPAPGHEESWEVSVKNVSNKKIALAVEVSGEQSVLLTEDSLLTFTLADSKGTQLLEESPVGRAFKTPLPVDELPAGESLTVSGKVKLPREAGNEYQGVNGEMKFTFTAIELDGGVTPTPTPTDPTSPSGSSKPTESARPTSPGSDSENNQNSGGNLAVTGATVATIAVVVVLVLGAGIGAVIIGRKRKLAVENEETEN